MQMSLSWSQELAVNKGYLNVSKVSKT